MGFFEGKLTARLVSGVLFVAVILITPRQALATPENSSETGRPCVDCHINGGGGGPLTEFGKAFGIVNGKIKTAAQSRGPLIKLPGVWRASVGFLHVTAAFLWFGTILYVHIILRPRYAEKGLPPSEVRLGGISMVVLGLTGLVLTLARVESWHTFTDGRWGILLSVKIILYVVMVLSAAYVVNVIGPKLKAGIVSAEHPSDGVFDPVTLEAFDGKDGRPAFVAYEGKVFDVSNLHRWKGGVHFRHPAGTELTAALGRAPHGPEKLAGLSVAGTYEEGKKPPISAPQKLFYFFAYMNLSLVFVVLLVVAFWRWWV